MILTLLPATQLPVFAANQKAACKNISNGYRTVFSDVEVGQAPDGWSGGDWSIITGGVAGVVFRYAGENNYYYYKPTMPMRARWRAHRHGAGRG